MGVLPLADERPIGERIGGRAWVLVLALALALRVAWAGAVPVSPVSDSRAYDVFARNLAVHGVYGWSATEPSAFWPVGAPFLYSLAYRTLGVDYRAVAATNVLLGLAIVVFTMLLAARWYGPRIAVVSGAIVAAWPSLVAFTTVLASELPFIALVLAAIHVWVAGPPRATRAVLAGLLLAAASYVRPTALLLPVLFGVFAWRRARPARAIALTLVVAATMAAAIAPWSFRNTRVYGRFVLVSANGGSNAWMGNNPGSDGFFMPLPKIEGANEAERDAILGAEARRYILENPARFVWRTLVKAVRLHERESIGVSWNEQGLVDRFGVRVLFPLKMGTSAYWWAACALALAGAVTLGRAQGWRAAGRPEIAIWIYFTAVHAVTVVQDRYHFIAIPFVAMLSALALSVWRAGIRSRASDTSATPAGSPP